MDNYARLGRNKLKTSKDLGDAYKHNERIYAVENADPALFDSNIELIETNGRSYEEMYEETIANLRASGVDLKTIRKDAVKGFEIILGFSREQTDGIDLEEWQKANLEWLDKVFNPPDHIARFRDGKTGEEKMIYVQNLKHVVLHMDESSPHIHAFIVPIDEKGHLNSHYYFAGRGEMMRLHTMYAEAMSRFGLERGEQGSTATRKDISTYHRRLNEAVHASLPEPEPGETVEQYKKRADEVYQGAMISHRNEIVKMEQKIAVANARASEQGYMRNADRKTLDALYDAAGTGREMEDCEERTHQFLNRAKNVRKAMNVCTDPRQRDDFISAINEFEKQWLPEMDLESQNRE